MSMNKPNEQTQKCELTQRLIKPALCALSGHSLTQFEGWVWAHSISLFEALFRLKNDLAVIFYEAFGQKMQRWRGRHCEVYHWLWGAEETVYRQLSEVRITGFSLKWIFGGDDRKITMSSPVLYIIQLVFLFILNQLRFPWYVSSETIWRLDVTSFLASGKEAYIFWLNFEALLWNIIIASISVLQV